MDHRDSLAWDKISDYLVEVGSSQTEEEFHVRAVNGIDAIVKRDAGSVLIAHDPGRPDGVDCVEGTSGQAWCREYNEYYRYRIPMPWSVVERTRVTDFTPWEHSEYVTDFLRPKRLWTALLMPNDTYLLALYRGRHSAPFTERDVASLRVVHAHLNNYYRIFSKLSLMSRERMDAAQRAIDCGRLTRREAQIVKFLALRMTAREIASIMFISYRTVEHHIANMYEKLRVHSRQALLRSVYHGNVNALHGGQAPAE
jgi:DNA-binding CsgD family transcriptional regulator